MPKKPGPQAGLEPRNCPICGESYQPYRDFQKTCGKRWCRERLPAIQERKREYFSRSDVRERKNVARRGRPHNLAYSKEYNFRRYGITREKYEELLSVQNGLCAICDRPPRPGTGPSTQRLHIDHRHDTGEVRGLLCSDCNTGLGLFQDDIEWLLKAVAYLKEGKTNGSSR